MKSYLILSTEVYAGIETPPIPMIKKEFEIKDKSQD